MSQQAWGLLTIVVTVIGSYLTSRLGSRAEARKTELTAAVERAKAKAEDTKNTSAADESAGRLALEIAQRAEAKADRLEKRVNRLNGWRQEVQAWWPGHNRFDQMVLDELENLDPGVTKRFPKPTRLPVYHEDEGATE